MTGTTDADADADADTDADAEAGGDPASEFGTVPDANADPAGYAVDADWDVGGAALGAGASVDGGDQAGAGPAREGHADAPGAGVGTGVDAAPDARRDAALHERLRAVERAVADEGVDLDSAPAPAGEDLRARIADAEERLAELEAGLQAVRGQLDHVAAVDGAVERRADAALSAAESAREAARRADPSDRTDAPRPPSAPDDSALPDPPAPPVDSRSGDGSLLDRLRARLPRSWP